MSSPTGPATRTAAALVVVLGVTVTLSGCLSPFEPAPIETSVTSGCVPETSTIYWDAATEASEANVGAYILPGTEAEAGAAPALVDLGLAAAFTWDAQNSTTAFEGEELELWQATLLQDARRTGQVDRDFGEPAPLPARPLSTGATTAPGTGVQVLSRPVVSMPFEIQCATGDVIEGTLDSVVNSTLANTFFLCDDNFELTSVQSEYARELCLLE